MHYRFSHVLSLFSIPLLALILGVTCHVSVVESALQVLLQK